MVLTRSGSSGTKKLDENEYTKLIKSTLAKSPKRKLDHTVNETVFKKSIKKDMDEIYMDKNKYNKVPLSKKLIKKNTDTSNKEVESDSGDWKNAENIYQFKANDIQGNQVSLDRYKDRVCIIVNVASRCGHTKSNYEQFVEMFDKYSDEKGLRILAFPCNQFGKQEPGTNDEIYGFTEKKNVKFDLFSKIDVNGKNAHPLWKFLTSKISGPKGNSIAWNFTKFIIDKYGNVVERHASAVKPLTLVDNLEKYW